MFFVNVSYPMYTLSYNVPLHHLVVGVVLNMHSQCLLRMRLWEGITKPIPTTRIVHLPLFALQSISRHLTHGRTLKHERQPSIQLGRFVAWILHIGVITPGIRSVRRHDGMQTGPAGDKASRFSGAFLFGIVFSVDESHELCHDISVEPGWSECVLVGSQNPRGKITKSANAVPSSSPPLAVNTV